MLQCSHVFKRLEAMKGLHKKSMEKVVRKAKEKAVCFAGSRGASKISPGCSLVGGSSPPPPEG